MSQRRNQPPLLPRREFLLATKTGGLTNPAVLGKGV